MSNPTTPFSWQMPTATDLVTDLPAEFEVFGQAVATSLADLLGGTTGQVLAKNSNTDMDFVWVAQDDSNAIQNAIVNAKGDIIGASANDTPAITSDGTNGQVLTADSTTATGLAWTTPAAGASFVGASMYHAAFNISLTNATSTKLTWTNAEEMWDTNGFHTESSGTRITIPSGKAGYYTINFGVGWDANANNRRVVNILKNNTDNLLSVETTSGTTYYPSTYGTVVASLSVGDYLEIQAYQDSGGTINCGKSLFQVVYLGA
jgi:hypothetical protein